MKKGKLIITITGPTCAGKSTLEAALNNEGIPSLISTTTREPRNGEEHGKHYYFTNHSIFLDQINKDGFVETAQVGENMYGLTVHELDRVLNQSDNCVVIVEPKGLKQVQSYCKKNHIRFFSVFLNVPAKVRAERFVKRHKQDLIDEKESVVQRIAHMIDTEVGWVMDAYLNNEQYEIIMDVPDGRVFEQLVSEILSVASNS